MPQTQYFQNQPTSLQDLLNQASLQPDASVETPGPPQASQVSTDGVMTPQERQKLMDILLAPEDAGPAPQVDKPNALAMLFSGLGDAVNAFAAGKSGDPGFRTHYFDQYQNSLNQQKADLQRYNEKVAGGKNRSKQRTAEFLLSESDRKQMRSDALQGQKDLKQLTLDSQRADREARVAASADAVAARREEIASREKIAKMQTDASITSERIQAQLHAKKFTDEADKDQHAEYAKSRQWIVSKKREYAQALADGKITPEQIRQEWQDTLDASDLTGDYKAAADAFWQDKIGAGLFQYEYENQGPRVNQGGALPPPPAQPMRGARGLRDVGGGI